MDQSGGLQGLALRLVSHLGRGESPQLLINKRE